MADGEPNQALLTTLTTEHFTLQGARSTTTSESAARSALYLGSVSSGLVALGFVAQVSQAGDVFRVFALVVLPTLFALGLFTFVRLVELSIEDILYGRAINRIRNYYLDVAGPESRYFMLNAHDDPLGVIRNMGIHPNRWQLYFTAASAVAVVNSVVGGVAVGLAIGIGLDPPLGVSVVAGGVVAVASFVLHMHVSSLRHQAGVEIDAIFPTPAG